MILNGDPLERVNEYKYLGSKMLEENCSNNEIISRINQVKCKKNIFLLKIIDIKVKKLLNYKKILN